MADVNANIGVNIDTSNALAQLKLLQREISRFHSSVARSSDNAALAQRDLQKNFINGVNAISGFSAELRTVRTTAENFTDSLERNKFSMREYFRYAGASTKTFGRFFRSEFDTINKVAVENVKRLQTQYIKMGRDANGAMRAIAVMPTKLDMTNLSTQTQLAAQRQAIFNQLVKQGSTNLLNFGKNTQWAGRQLMVGFTIPLIGLGSVASRTFMEMEQAAIKFKKVYGDLFTAPEETQFALESIQMLGQEFTKYGIAVADTVSLAAEAAAAGFEGSGLQAQVTQATRLQVLGQVDQQKALETTISLQNAFRISSTELADAVNFLNAVENQTVLSLQDIAEAVPRVGPIITELGGDVKDLAFFLTAMKEGGVSAAQGANALKAGLGRLINPTSNATDFLEQFNINIKEIVENNAGDLRATVIAFAKAIQPLDDLNKSRAVEKVFGKFQFARTLALLNNITRDGTQAARVLELATASAGDLAALAESELGITADSAMNKFRAAVESLKMSLVPVGETFLQVITPILDKLNGLLEWFNGLSDTSKKVITKVLLYVGGLAPVLLMTIGLMANFVANGIKGLMLLRNGFLRLTGQSQVLSEQTSFLTQAQQNAIAAAASLEQSHINLQQVFTGEAGALRQLVAEYERMIAAQNMAATRFPGMMQPGFKVKGYANGVVSVPGPKGAGDIIPAMLSPGEAVIPAKMVEKYGGLINGMVSDSIPGFKTGLKVKQVPGAVNPNTFVSAHFSDRRELSSSEMDALLDADGLSARIRAVIVEAREAGRSVYAYTDSVIALSHQMNQDLKNNTADVTSLQTMISENLKSTHTELVRRMQAAGVPQAEIDAAATSISRDILASLPKAGLIGEQEFNAITRSAYERAAASNPAVRAAYGEMQEYSTIGDPMARGGRGERLSLPARFKARIGSMFFRGGSYKNRRNQYADVIEQTGGTYERQYYAKVQSQAEEVVNGAIVAAEQAAQTQSPSRRTIPIGEDIARGLQVGMENQADETRAAAEKLTGSVAGGLIDPRTGLPFGEVAARKRVTETEVKSMVSSLILPGQGKGNAGGLILPGQGGTSGGPLILPGSNFVSDNLIDPRTGQPFRKPGQTTFLGMPGMAADPRGPLTEDVLNEAYRENRVRNLKAIPGKIGSAAAKGLGKVAGAGGGFGLSGLVFALSMLPGKFGELSKSMMPAIFAFQSFQMLSRIIGGLPAVLLALSAGFYMLQKSAEKSAQKIADAAKQEAEARFGSTQAINEYAEFTDSALPSAREFSRNNRRLISASQKAVDRFNEFYQQEGNRSAAIISRAARRGPEAGIGAAAVDIAQRASILGLEPSDIAANIKAAANLIGADQIKLKMAVQEILSPDGKDITKEPLTIEARINFLREQAVEQINNIKDEIEKISQIEIPSFGRFANDFDFKALERTAGYQSLRNQFAKEGGFLGTAKKIGVNIGTGAVGDRFADQLKLYKDIQGQVQSATAQLSISFTQQTEALALLNSQYADGIITKEEYDAQMITSSDNFAMMTGATKDLVSELEKLDPKLAADALKDLGNQAFAALKKTNPRLFAKLAKSMEDLDNASQIDIMMAYTQGSLTVLDIARLPELLKEIDGKTFEAKINILTERGIAPGFLESETRSLISSLEREIRSFAGRTNSADAQRTLVRLREELKIARATLAEIEESKKVNQKVTDPGGGKSGGAGGKGDLEDFYKRELRILNKKLNTLKDINAEMDRQNQYQMKQMDLINQASRAKISGDFLQAAQLQQQSMLEGAKFTRESQELQLERIIKKVENRQEIIKEKDKIFSKDYALRNKLRAGEYESVVPTPTTPGVGFNAGATGFAGSTTTVGGSMYTITMNISGENATDIANKVMNKLQILENKKNKSNKVR